MVEQQVYHAAGVRKRFGRKVVLDDFDLTLHRGEVTVLLGENGTGKSTLMRLAMGTERAQQGSLEVVGLDPIREQAKVLRRVGYVPSVPDVYGWMRPGDLFGFLRPQFPAWDEAWVQQLCGMLDVPLRTKFAQMSRGQGMKTMLVAALAHRPELLLLDEPFGGLDPLVRDDVLAGVIASLREEECTVLCATHDLEVAARMADRVVTLADGRIVRDEKIEAIESAAVSLPAALKQGLVEARQREEVVS